MVGVLQKIFFYFLDRIFASYLIELQIYFKECPVDFDGNWLRRKVFKMNKNVFFSIVSVFTNSDFILRYLSEISIFIIQILIRSSSIYSSRYRTNPKFLVCFITKWWFFFKLALNKNFSALRPESANFLAAARNKVAAFRYRRAEK